MPKCVTDTSDNKARDRRSSSGFLGLAGVASGDVGRRSGRPPSISPSCPSHQLLPVLPLPVSGGEGNTSQLTQASKNEQGKSKTIANHVPGATGRTHEHLAQHVAQPQAAPKIVPTHPPGATFSSRSSGEKLQSLLINASSNNTACKVRGKPKQHIQDGFVLIPRQLQCHAQQT